MTVDTSLYVFTDVRSSITNFAEHDVFLTNLLICQKIMDEWESKKYPNNLDLVDLN